MASSRKPAVNLIDTVGQILKKYISDQQFHITVAVSGGLDSVVLLYVCWKLADLLPLSLHALHINHQLQPINKSMEEFVTSICQDWSIPLSIERVECDLNAGLGLENAARTARYNIFKNTPTDFLLLAHHANDQAETLLTQFFRGAGLPGLSAMPEQRLLAGSAVQLLRPFLQVSRAEILELANRYQLKWIEDPSNQNVYYQRNYIRQILTPVIEQKFPHWLDVAERTRSHFVKAQKLLNDLAQIDVLFCAHENSLVAEKVISLGEERAANLIRYWLAKQGLPVPQQSQWLNWWQQVLLAQPDKHPRLSFANISLVSDRGYWYVIANLEAWVSFELRQWPMEEIDIPGVGILTSSPVFGAGINVESLNHGVVVSRRRGGESIKIHPHRPHKAIKKIFQELDIPLWARDYWPFIMNQQGIVAIPGIGVSVEHQASPDEWGVELAWRFNISHGQGGGSHVKI
ncbi:tRNA(Ile)-lysidine synthase [Ferrovum sp. JA12]|uniref:tRNA lysidine(34) synthetase TilS n=1 Tax=Ferrovum sp. JA12 TaxID=1356299 RepID=UPI0007034B0C|nr:tRNA lysidine(34) synthetase TilS [Ferrovum sp. JA12]KRH78856.1 tRNA(Ile)-lysidine synthase [Ferrovum sp. JA12]